MKFKPSVRDPIQMRGDRYEISDYQTLYLDNIGSPVDSEIKLFFLTFKSCLLSYHLRDLSNVTIPCTEKCSYTQGFVLQLRLV